MTLQAATCSLLEVSCAAPFLHGSITGELTKGFSISKEGSKASPHYRCSLLLALGFRPASLSTYLPSLLPLLLLVSKVGQSRNILCSKAQRERATSEPSSPVYASWAVHCNDRNRWALLPDLESRLSRKGCGRRWINTRAVLGIPTAPRMESDSSSPSLSPSSSSSHTDTGQRYSAHQPSCELFGK